MFMRALSLLLLAMVGCTVQPSNPFDPASSNPAKGFVVGRLVSDAGIPLKNALVRVSAEGSNPTPVPVAPDGAFRVELAPGVYALEAGAAAHASARLTGLRVHRWVAPGRVAHPATLLLG